MLNFSFSLFLPLLSCSRIRCAHTFRHFWCPQALTNNTKRFFHWNSSCSCLAPLNWHRFEIGSFQKGQKSRILSAQRQIFTCYSSLAALKYANRVRMLINILAVHRTQASINIFSIRTRSNWIDAFTVRYETVSSRVYFGFRILDSLEIDLFLFCLQFHCLILIFSLFPTLSLSHPNQT